MTAQVRGRHWKRWLVIGIAAAAFAMVGGPFIYIHFIEGKAPAPLALAEATPSATPSTGGTTTSTGSRNGTWNVTDGSVVGYRVNEVLFGQSHTAVGRTSSITGSMTVVGTKITQASFTVDMTTVTSDQSRRDEQFNGRIMETGTYPTATFTLTQGIDLGSSPTQGAKHTFQATGDLTIHDVTRTVTFQVSGQYSGSAAQIAGSIPITFADYNIGNPSFGPVTKQDHGVLEFALSFAHA
jgi:polyisoprenoid-binding protein YceI